MMNKEQVTKKIYDIVDMNSTELCNFESVVHTSNVDAKAKYFLLEAIDIRREQLDSRVDAIAVPSELRIGEA